VKKVEVQSHAIFVGDNNVALQSEVRNGAEHGCPGHVLTCGDAQNVQ